MKARAVLCPSCKSRMRRKHGYKKRFWKCESDGYRVVYLCKECGTTLALVTLEEQGYLAIFNEIGTELQQARREITTLRIKLNAYREKTNTARLNTELDALEKSINRLRTRLREM